MNKPKTLKDAVEFATPLSWDDLALAIMGIERLLWLEKHHIKERKRLETILSIYEVEKAYRLKNSEKPVNSRYLVELLGQEADIHIEPDDDNY